MGRVNQAIFADPCLGVSPTRGAFVTADNHPTGKNDHTVPATCQTHRGCRGFCNLRMTKVNGEIVFDPHVAGCCVVSLDENQATTVRDILTEWLG